MTNLGKYWWESLSKKTQKEMIFVHGLVPIEEIFEEPMEEVLNCLDSSYSQSTQSGNPSNQEDWESLIEGV